MIRRCLPVVLALALSACGFHLRNALVLPEDLGSVRVRSVDRYSPLADSLAQSLQRAGARIAAADDLEATVLDLRSERWGDTPIAVDQFGRAQELSLRYAVVFELRRADGSMIVPRQTVELARDYISNPVAAIGTEGEREILMREMRREMAASIIRRLDAVARASGPAALPTSRMDEPVAEDAARAALEAADANPPPDADPPAADLDETDVEPGEDANEDAEPNEDAAPQPEPAPPPR